MVDVVLPALDEASSIEAVLARMPPGFRPIVVDNGSTDATAALAREAAAIVVEEPRRGFGAACFAGLGAATAEVVCFMDCDGSLDPLELPRVARPVHSGHSDLVLGARQAQAGAWPCHARLANRAITIELRRRCGLRLQDLGPMRAGRRTDLLDLGIADRRFGWPLEMVLRAAAAHWRIEEVAVTYRARHGGRSKVTGSVRGTARTIRDMGAVLS
ncbi:MAG: glycosyltransferase family 2 protein [Thermoleophilaceae bacterium]